MVGIDMNLFDGTSISANSAMSGADIAKPLNVCMLPMRNAVASSVELSFSFEFVLLIATLLLKLFKDKFRDGKTRSGNFRCLVFFCYPCNK